MAKGPAADVRIVFDRIPEINASIKSAVSMVLRKAALETEGIAKTLVPVDTGALKNSIATNTSADTGSGYGADVYTAQHYAAFVEYGTRYMGEQPYLTPAFDRVAPGALAACKAILEVSAI